MQSWVFPCKGPRTASVHIALASIHSYNSCQEGWETWALAGWPCAQMRRLFRKEGESGSWGGTSKQACSSAHVRAHGHPTAPPPCRQALRADGATGLAGVSRESVAVDLQALGEQAGEGLSSAGSGALLLSSHVGSHRLFLCNFCPLCLLALLTRRELRYRHPRLAKATRSRGHCLEEPTLGATNSCFPRPLLVPPVVSDFPVCAPCPGFPRPQRGRPGVDTRGTSQSKPGPWVGLGTEHPVWN